MKYRTENPAASKALIEQGWTYLDVRTEEEFAAGHAPGSYCVPAFFRGPLGTQPNPEFVAVVKRHFATDAKLVLGCAAGVRSMHACEALAEAGYTQLVNMHGGFAGARDQGGQVTEAGWAACGFPVTAEADGKDYATLKG